MTKKLFRYIGVLILIALIIAALSICRNIMLDKGMLALKEENSSKAIHYLRPLAIIGDPEAQDLLGEMYALGLGINKDDIEAIKWFKKAGSKRAAKYEYNIAEQYRRFYEEGSGNTAEIAVDAIKWYKISAEDGYPKAAEFLGRVYSEGLMGLPRDPKQSQYWYDKAKTMNNL